MTAQSSIHIGTVMPSHHAIHSFPPERRESWRYVVTAAHTGDQSGGEVQTPLNAIHATPGGSSPDGQAIYDMRKDVCVDEELEGVGSTVLRIHYLLHYITYCKLSRF